VATPACRVDADRERLLLAGHLAACGLAGAAGPGARSSGHQADTCEVQAWARSGGMWLTGHPEGPPRPAPTGFPARVEALRRLLGETTARLGSRIDADVWELLFGRAGERGAARQGRRSAGGSCRLLAAADGWLAVNLSRPDDAELVPAILAEDTHVDPWAALAATARTRPAADLADRAQLLGVPAAALPDRAAPPVPFTARRVGTPWDRAGRPATVVDLSAMWAGPLCAHLLGRAGARVIKVESPRRPDGARIGDPELFDRLHHGHASVILDLRSPHRVHQLRRLMGGADVVIESSRPRALRQLGIDAEAELAAHPGLVWVSITGYGREGPGADRVAFGDDAAVAGGLVGRDDEGGPVFCGDAIADPLTGTVAAIATAASLAVGGGHLLDLSMTGVAAWAAGSDPAWPAGHPVEAQDGTWAVRCGTLRQTVTPPGRPKPLRK
jgi:hypothetical protein